jgi:hypothetical protein
MEEEREEGVRVDVGDAGPEFSADEVAVSHSPIRFIVDFKSITPRLDVHNHPPRHVLKHNIIKIDPFLAKDFLEVLKKNIEKFEKHYGKISKPKAIEKAQEEAKKKGKTPAFKQDYFG